MHPLSCLQHRSCSLQGVLSPGAPVRSPLTSATRHSPHTGPDVSPPHCHPTGRVPAAPPAHTSLSPPRGCPAALLEVFPRQPSTCCHQPPADGRCTKSQPIPSTAGSLFSPNPQPADTGHFQTVTHKKSPTTLCPDGNLSLSPLSLLPPAMSRPRWISQLCPKRIADCSSKGQLCMHLAASNGPRQRVRLHSLPSYWCVTP